VSGAVIDPAASASREPPAPLYTAAYLRYALGILCVVYVANFLDRQILSILLQSIKEDLALTDVQLGLLSGTAFGLFYATLGVPIARLADRVSRKAVIAVCLALWSCMTVLCGTAARFEQLFVYRMGVGVGEAGGSPPAHSMISDYFPPERRATALGVFALGVPVGLLIGYLVGGWLDEVASAGGSRSSSPGRPGSCCRSSSRGPCASRRGDTPTASTPRQTLHRRCRRCCAFSGGRARFVTSRSGPR
jgi:sugar phosphate permease